MRRACLGFLLANDATWPNEWIDDDQAALQALRTFKSKVMQRWVRPWHDKSELRGDFAISLGNTIKSAPRPGWGRAPDISRLYPALDAKTKLDDLGIAAVSSN